MPVSDQKSIRITLPATGRTDPVPEPTQPLSGDAREMWDAWWRSPMATQWNVAADVFPLTRLALMYDHQRLEGVTDRVTVEMRQLESQFGLSPKGRKELGWVIDADVAVAAAPADEVERKRKERRSRLEAS